MPPARQNTDEHDGSATAAWHRAGSHPPSDWLGWLARALLEAVARNDRRHLNEQERSRQRVILPSGHGVDREPDDDDGDDARDRDQCPVPTAPPIEHASDIAPALLCFQAKLPRPPRRARKFGPSHTVVRRVALDKRIPAWAPLAASKLSTARISPESSRRVRGLPLAVAHPTRDAGKALGPRRRQHS
eukprot:916276-Rhodomonas_salina.1